MYIDRNWGLLIVAGILILMFVVWMLGRRGASRRTGLVLAADARARVTGFVIAVLLIPQALTSTIRIAVQIAGDIVISVTNIMTANGGQWDQHNVADIIAGVFTILLRGITAFPYIEIAAFMLIWVLISHGIGAAIKLDVTWSSARARSWIESARPWLSSLRMANFRFFMILAFSGYLSIAAITAIPWLKETSSSAPELSVDNLRAQLETAYSRFDGANAGDLDGEDPLHRLALMLETQSFRSTPTVLPEAGAPVPAPTETPIVSGAQRESQNFSVQLSRGSVTVADSATASPTVSAPPTPAALPTAVDDAMVASLTDEEMAELLARMKPEQLIGLQQWVIAARNERRTLVLKLKAAEADAATTLTEAKEKAVRHYQVSDLQRIGHHERAQHFLELGTWYGEQVTTLEHELGECRALLDQLDRDLQAWYNEDRDYMLMSSLSFSLLNHCDETAVNSSPPERLSLGSNFLGPFGPAARWLLRTESLQLALVTGMLGFGLLGAACSTIIRERATETDLSNAPIVKDLTGVVIRGTLAAVVVFLAVSGGLAVFAAGTSEPNPYALLLTCLIAAIFSEPVWVWAQQHMSVMFGGGARKSADLTANSTASDEQSDAPDDPRGIDQGDSLAASAGASVAGEPGTPQNAVAQTSGAYIAPKPYQNNIAASERSTIVETGTPELHETQHAAPSLGGDEPADGNKGEEEKPPSPRQELD